jgi:hypothetical protein
VGRDQHGAERAARRRLADAHALARRLAGDLDAIALTAIAKERDRRYATPRALADDVERHLRLEPIEARPAAPWTRAVKFARRNRALTAGGVAAVAALVIGLAASLVFLREARASAASELAAAGQAEAATAEAEANLAAALRAVEQMASRVSEVDVARSGHLQGVRDELLQRALAFYRQLIAEHGGDPRLAAEVERARDRVAAIERQASAAPADGRPSRR